MEVSLFVLSKWRRYVNYLYCHVVRKVTWNYNEIGLLCQKWKNRSIFCHHQFANVIINCWWFLVIFTLCCLNLSVYYTHCHYSMLNLDYHHSNLFTIKWAKIRLPPKPGVLIRLQIFIWVFQFFSQYFYYRGIFNSVCDFPDPVWDAIILPGGQLRPVCQPEPHHSVENFPAL